MVYPYPTLPRIYIPGEKQESSQPVKMEKPWTGESRACSWAMPQITRGTYRMWNPKTKKVSKTCDVVFLNRMFFGTHMMPVHKKQGTGDDFLDSVQQDERGGTSTADFVTCDNDAATVESMDFSVQDTPMVNSNPGQSKYGCTYRRTMHYDPMTGCTIGTVATALANYYQCFEDTDGMMEFTNIGAGI
jgi:hypothetical protein